MKKKILAVALILMLCPCFATATELPHSMGLTGVGNARELGGYPAGDGRVVKHGVFLRTASLAGATDKDKERLKDDYQLSVVIDLRMTREKESAPDPEIPGVRNIHLGIIDEVAVAEKVNKLSPEDLEIMKNGNQIDRLKLSIKAGIVSNQMYIEWLSSATGKAGYAQMFEEIINLPEGKALLFHCTQGKDRTGCAAMLILSALGVDEETILKDYMLTNTYNADRIDNERQMLIEQGYEGEELNRYMKAMDEVDIQYMENALTWMKDNYGSVKGYITQELGVTEAQIEQLQARYLHNMTAHPAKEATCTEAGNKAYWTCDCGKYFSDAQGENEIKKDDVVIQAKGHTSVKDPAVAPTHTNTGLTEGSHCSVCGAIIKNQEVVQKLAKDPQPMTVKATKKTVKASKLKKKKQVISPITVKSAQGTVSYKITGGNKKSKKALKINKNTGKVTVKKKTKKGTYKVKVKVTAAGNENYKVGSKTVSVKVVVK